LKSDSNSLFGSKTTSGGFGGPGIGGTYKKSPSWLDEDEPKEKSEGSGIGGDDKSLKK
jgi:hypothetical protein